MSDIPEQENPNPLFALAKQYPFFARTPRRRRIAAKLDQIIGLAGLSAMPASIPIGHRNPYQAGHQYLDIAIEGTDDFLAKIPKTGPTLVVANHPYGALDALIASDLTLRVRPDALIFGNAVLVHPVHEEWLLPLEILDESSAARRRNLDSMRRALTHLQAGGCVLIFPAGEVERWRWPRLRIEEGAWTAHLARLALKSKATILPLAYPGENPLWFHLPGALHPTLRLLALPRAFLSLRGRTIPIRTGQPIPIESLPSDPHALTEAVRQVVLRLAGREDQSDGK
ncbi:MAG: 1-acyl-sn-glycerol-3-phosphate acyltransferase [Roseibacillus sp.]